MLGCFTLTNFCTTCFVNSFTDTVWVPTTVYILSYTANYEILASITQPSLNCSRDADYELCSGWWTSLKLLNKSEEGTEQATVPRLAALSNSHARTRTHTHTQWLRTGPLTCARFQGHSFSPHGICKQSYNLSSTSLTDTNRRTPAESRCGWALICLVRRLSAVWGRKNSPLIIRTITEFRERVKLQV